MRVSELDNVEKRALLGERARLDTPNASLPPLERALQASLLHLIIEFAEIANQIDYLYPSEEWVSTKRVTDAWSEALTSAFTHTVATFGGRWV